MKLDTEIERFIALMREDWRRHPPLSEMTVIQARAAAENVRARWREGGPAMARIDEQVVDLPEGPLRLRLYRPQACADASAAAPVLIYLHGGGFVLFSLDTHDRLMREYAQSGGLVVIGVEYPLSPEAKYPRALDLAVSLVRWLEQNGPALGLDTGRIAIGGDSAGANLALATCLKLRDAGEPRRLRAVLSNYGAFSPEVSDEAERTYGGPDAILNRAEMAYYFDSYLPADASTHDFYACPLGAADLSDLPPVLFVNPECDILREQSEALAARLRMAGSAIEERLYAGATHSFLEAMSIAAVARAAIADASAWLRARLASAP